MSMFELIQQLRFPVTATDAAGQWNRSFNIAQQRLWNAERQGLLIAVKIGNRKLYSPSALMLRKILEENNG